MKKLKIVAFAGLASIVVGFLVWMRFTSPTASDSQPKVLHLFAMSDYFPAAVITAFEQAHHCKVQYDNFSSNEELLAKLQAGAEGYDVIVPSDYIVPALVHGGLIRQLDFQMLPHLKNLAPEFRTVPFDPVVAHTVPYTWGTSGLIYNSKYVTSTPTSWGVLFDAAVAGHISLLDDEREVLGAMLMKLGYSPNTTDPAQLQQAQQLLIKLKPSVRLFASDPKQQLLSGDVWIAHIYSGDARQVMRQQPTMRYFTPHEGAMMFIDVLAIPTGAANPELAYAFIDNILEPAVAKAITEELLYSSPNAALEASLSDATLKPSYLQQLRAGGRLEFLQDLGGASEAWDNLWTAAKSR